MARQRRERARMAWPDGADASEVAAPEIGAHDGLLQGYETARAPTEQRAASDQNRQRLIVRTDQDQERSNTGEAKRNSGQQLGIELVDQLDPERLRTKCEQGHERGQRSRF